MSKTYLTPYLNFQGGAREAMEFYQGVFGGILTLFAAGEGGQPRPAEEGDSIMFGRLDADGVIIVGSDGDPRWPAKVGENVALAVHGSDEAEVTRIFNSLAEGGTVKMPLTKMPWGTAGWLADRFGFNWNIDIEAG